MDAKTSEPGITSSRNAVAVTTFSGALGAARPAFSAVVGRAVPSAPQMITIAIGAASTAVLVILFLFDPAHHHFYPVCALHNLTGLNCPGCGASRAMHQLLHGNVIAALHLNALVVACLPIGAFHAGRAGLRLLRAKPGRFEIKPVWIWIGGASVLIFAILRNLPFEIFAWLRP